MLKKDGNPLGALKGMTYIPHSFVEARRNGIIEQLHRDGILGIEPIKSAFECGRINTMFIGLETFRAEGLENIPDLHILEKHVITEGYIAQLKIMVVERLRTEGWAEVKVCDRDPII